jgi:carbamoyltransferase
VNILGISALYHDSAAALVQDGTIVAAAQEERFTRKKNDAGFPRRAIAYCLHAGGVPRHGIDAVVYYDKPFTTFSRLLRTYLKVGIHGARSFTQAMPVWFRQKLWIPVLIEQELRELGFLMPKQLWFTEHHESHAASAFFASPFNSAAVLTFDGVGEWATSSIGVGRANRLDLKEQIYFPDSIGLLYSAFTHFCGFRVNSGEYKLMGLAPYGEPTYVSQIFQNLIDVKEDGSFKLNLAYFDFLGGATMTNQRFDDLFGGPPRKPEAEFTRRELDLARSIQVVTEDVLLRIARHAASMTGEENACLAGGVALNCVANGRLLREGPFKRLWIQPAAGDAGGAIGAALSGWYQISDHPRSPDEEHDSMGGAYLGPAFSDEEIRAYLERHGLPFRAFYDRRNWAMEIAEHVAEGKIIGLFQGRMEFGPRALGNRSIIGDARSVTMQSDMNLKIKFRESFRPFAPAVLAERAEKFFDIEADSPYMMLVAPIREEHRLYPRNTTDVDCQSDLRTWVHQVRSSLPAITHVDYSARLQTVDGHNNPSFHAILEAFESLTGCPVVINTSFNVRGEPIVCTPDDAYRCFMRTAIDYLVLGPYLLDKREQPAWREGQQWKQDLVLD